MTTYRGYEEGDPAHHDKHGRGEVDGEDEGAQGPAQQAGRSYTTLVFFRCCDVLSMFVLSK